MSDRIAPGSRPATTSTVSGEDWYARELRSESFSAVEFRDVTFGYDPANPVLHHVNLAVKPGEVIAVVMKEHHGDGVGDEACDGDREHDGQVDRLPSQKAKVPGQSTLRCAREAGAVTSATMALLRKSQILALPALSVS